MPTPTRRDILKLATHTLLGGAAAFTLAGLIRFLGYQSAPPPPQEIDLGPAENFPIGASTVVVSVPAIVRRTSKGYTAISLKCTHLGCTVEHKGDTFVCPCHGSRFDREGKRTRGPAARDLASLRAEPNASGHLILYVG